MSARAIPLAMLTAAEADRAYRLREGTARKAAIAGQIRSAWRVGRGRNGQVLYVNAQDADHLWGGEISTIDDPTPTMAERVF